MLTLFNEDLNDEDLNEHLVLDLNEEDLDHDGDVDAEDELESEVK